MNISEKSRTTGNQNTRKVDMDIEYIVWLFNYYCIV